MPGTEQYWIIHIRHRLDKSEFWYGGNWHHASMDVANEAETAFRFDRRVQALHIARLICDFDPIVEAEVHAISTLEQ